MEDDRGLLVFSGYVMSYPNVLGALVGVTVSMSFQARLPNTY
jgi:hypothetical protein